MIDNFELIKSLLFFESEDIYYHLQILRRGKDHVKNLFGDMYDNYNYPAGADNEMAPWNQKDVPDLDFEVTCSQTLSKTVTVTTDNYIPGASGCDYEPDGEGGYCACGYQDPADTSDTNWSEEYSESGHYTPLELIEKYKEELSEALKKLEEYGKSLHSKKPYWWIQRKRNLEHLIEECEGWIEDETDFEGE